MWEKVRIETEGGIVLRPFEPSDVDAVYKACQDAMISTFTTIPQPYGRHHAEQFVEENTKQFQGRFVMATTESEELRGLTGIVAYDDRYQEGEIGYWVAPAYRGLASSFEAPLAMCHWALDVAKIRRLVGVVDLNNIRSWRVAHSLGFRIEGIGRDKIIGRNGQVSDAALGSVLSSSEMPPLNYKVLDA